MEECLTENSCTGSLIFTFSITQIIVKREPALKGILMNIGLDEISIRIVILEKSLILLDIKSRSMRKCI